MLALPTYQTELSTGGLTHWQAILASTRPTQQTQGQDGGFDLLAELQKKPEIRTAVTGDRPVVLTPCRLPPQPEKVAAWLAAKTEYLQQRQLQENPSTEEREKSHEEQKSAVADVELEENNNAIEKQIHSTPVAPRRPSELNFPTCTPIGVGTSRKSVVESPTSPGTSEDSISRRTSKAPHDVLRKVVLNTQLKNQFHTPAMRRSISQIEGPTLDNTYGFKVTQQNLQDAKALHEIQNLTVISMELHVRTRRELRPDPEYDPISPPPVRRAQNCRPLLPRSGVTSLQVTYVAEEKELVQHFAQLIRQWDPDILVGYEVQMLSWGYLLQRAATLDMDLCPLLSRVPADAAKESTFSSDQDEWGADQMSEINIVGRIVINVWRLMRRELALNNYTFENVAFHAMHQRVPCTPSAPCQTGSTTRLISSGNLQLLEQMDLIGRTSELARLFGIQFYHVLTRGSQYRVESMMLRIAKPMNYIAVSPSMQQRARQRAPECLPLILEPESRFYTHPVLVLDFQSLYPSIIIAYNYCYTTCLGRVEHLAESRDKHHRDSGFCGISRGSLRDITRETAGYPAGVCGISRGRLRDIPRYSFGRPVVSRVPRSEKTWCETPKSTAARNGDGGVPNVYVYVLPGDLCWADGV
ncbi:error-prone translesion synthesis [Branchiostoma belcheri]|nr:error-prone translesion synthesis [Branchiostoma belcheri]